MSEFVFSQPEIVEKMGEMRKEYEIGKRTSFADSGLGKKKE
jgi:hypothetical protein